MNLRRLFLIVGVLCVVVGLHLGGAGLLLVLLGAILHGLWMRDLREPGYLNTLFGRDI